jgi:hypothetical protein
VRERKVALSLSHTHTQSERKGERIKKEPLACKFLKLKFKLKRSVECKKDDFLFLKTLNKYYIAAIVGSRECSASTENFIVNILGY